MAANSSESSGAGTAATLPYSDSVWSTGTPEDHPRAEQQQQQRDATTLRKVATGALLQQSLVSDTGAECAEWCSATSNSQKAASDKAPAGSRSRRTSHSPSRASAAAADSVRTAASVGKRDGVAAVKRGVLASKSSTQSPSRPRVENAIASSVKRAIREMSPSSRTSVAGALGPWIP